MPFNADLRCGLYKLELNINEIISQVESLTDCYIYDWSVENKAKMYNYVLLIEDAYTSMNHSLNTNFWDWFVNNYDNVETWNEIADILVENDDEDDEEELKQIGWRKQTRIGECEGCKMICEECERLVITEEDNNVIKQN